MGLRLNASKFALWLATFVFVVISLISSVFADSQTSSVVGGSSLAPSASPKLSSNRPSATSMPSITPSSTDRIHSSSESSKVTSKEQSGSRTSSSGQSKSSSASFSVSIDPRLAPGGVTLLQPEPTLVDYVKSGDNVTFSWTYTSLIVTPSAINIEAYCTKNDYYYTIANNHSATDMNVIWDTSNTGSESTNDSTPLLMANYILYMYDSEKEVDKTIASAGYLAQFNSFKFGIYKPQANVSNENYNCVNCKSGALQSGRISIIGPFFAALAIALIHF